MLIETFALLCVNHSVNEKILDLHLKQIFSCDFSSSDIERKTEDLQTCFPTIVSPANNLKIRE